MLIKRFGWYWRVTRLCFCTWAGILIAISPFTILCMYVNLATLRLCSREHQFRSFSSCVTVPGLRLWQLWRILQPCVAPPLCPWYVSGYVDPTHSSHTISGCSGGQVVSTLASHQCGPGFIPGWGSGPCAVSEKGFCSCLSYPSLGGDVKPLT